MAPAQPQVIVVCGATGTQGGGVLEALQGHTSFKVRAVSRNANSKVAKALAADHGIEVVSADLSKPETLPEAFAGAYGIFLVTEAGFASPDEEFQHGKNAADAAQKAGVKHIVLSAILDPRPYDLDLPVDPPSGVRLPHFESKARIREYIKSIGLPLTSVYPGSFMENFFKYPDSFCFKGPQGNLFWSNNTGDTKSDWHSNQAMGTAVVEALDDPETSIGKDFAPKSDFISSSDVAAAISAATGTPFSYYFMPDEQARALPFPPAVAFANMNQFIRDFKPAQEWRAGLPRLGHGPTIQQFAQQHKADFESLFKNATQVG